MFSYGLGDIRRELRSESNPTAKFIDKYGDIYRIEADEFAVDVWRFDRLLAAADGSDSRESLSAAADLYRPELLEGVYYDWSEPLRPHFYSKVIDALVERSRPMSEKVTSRRRPKHLRGRSPWSPTPNIYVDN